MRLLMFGATGQVAREVLRSSGPDLEIVALDRADANLSNPGDCKRALEDVAKADAIDAVLNAAAFTAVDNAEGNAVEAHRVNASAPEEIAMACASRGLPLLHVSTDYVFDGSAERPWKETDVPAPLGVYGESKLAGEQAVRAAGGPHVILRTAWVFSAHGSNFVKTMLRAGRTGPLRVVADQTGGPTPAASIAAALIAIARAYSDGRGVDGIFHFCGAPTASWHDLAVEIFARTGWSDRPKVHAISTADWPTPAARPANSALDCAKIRKHYGISQPDWRAGLEAVLKDLGET